MASCTLLCHADSSSRVQESRVFWCCKKGRRVLQGVPKSQFSILLSIELILSQLTTVNPLHISSRTKSSSNIPLACHRAGQSGCRITRSCYEGLSWLIYKLDMAGARTGSHDTSKFPKVIPHNTTNTQMWMTDVEIWTPLWSLWRITPGPGYDFTTTATITDWLMNLQIGNIFQVIMAGRGSNWVNSGAESAIIRAK